MRDQNAYAALEFARLRLLYIQHPISLTTAHAPAPAGDRSRACQSAACAIALLSPWVRSGSLTPTNSETTNRQKAAPWSRAVVGRCPVRRRGGRVSPATVAKVKAPLNGRGCGRACLGSYGPALVPEAPIGFMKKDSTKAPRFHLVFHQISKERARCMPRVAPEVGEMFECSCLRAS